VNDEVRRGDLDAKSNPLIFALSRETIKSFNNEWDIPEGLLSSY
jgi:hypothetical protein